MIHTPLLCRTALSNGFCRGHGPSRRRLLSDIRERCSVSEYLIDCGVVGGVNKIYPHFPHDLQAVSKPADISSMPHSVGENADFSPATAWMTWR